MRPNRRARRPGVQAWGSDAERERAFIHSAGTGVGRPGGRGPTVPFEPGQNVGGRPVVPNEPPQYGGGAPPPRPPWTPPPNPRAPYEGGPTIQQQATPGVEAEISKYYVGGGPSGQRYEDWLNSEYGQIEGRTTNRFADMFSKYVDVANREAGRQSAQIGESLGSRGALYSSANLAQQADLRQRTSQDIAHTAAEYQTQLEEQRQRDWQAVMQGQAGLATAEYGAREAAMGRSWQDFLRRSDVQPLYGAGYGSASGRPGGGYTTY